MTVKMYHVVRQLGIWDVTVLCIGPGLGLAQSTDSHNIIKSKVNMASSLIIIQK